MISLGIGEIPKRFYCIKPNSFLKIGFDTNVKTNDDRKEERAKLIERITRLLTEGKEDYDVIRDNLVAENIISFEKHNPDGVYYVSRSSLSNHIRTARNGLGISYVYDKVKILNMFDEGFSRKEIEAAGFDHTNVYSVLVRNGRILRKKDIKNGKCK